MKRSLYSLLLLCLIATTAWAQDSKDSTIQIIDYSSPQEYTIGGIAVRGDDNLLKAIVLQISGLSVGQKVNIPGEDMSKALTSLWKTGYFGDIQLELDSASGSTAYLSIYVQSRPKLGKTDFPSMSKSKSKKLYEETGLTAKKDIVNEQLLVRTTSRIKKYYTDKGYPNAKVDIEQEFPKQNGQNTVDLHIRVNKGKRIKIHEIDIQGNESIADKKLKKQMKNTKERQKLNVFRSSKFKPDEYETDKATLIQYYHTKGYKDAKIISDSQYVYEDNYININIKVEEGHKYYFRDIVWSGNTKYKSSALNDILNIKKGDVYNPALLEKNLYMNPASLDITTLYMDDGYLFFNVNPVETRIDGDSVDMEIRIFEGPQAIIRYVTVKGNTKTHDHVILRELRTKPGNKFSRSDVIRSQRELSMLGYFDPEQMNVTPKPNPQDGTVDLEYTVVEKPSDQIELSGGYGAGRLVGVLGLSLNNFSIKNIFKNNWNGYPSGDGQKLTMRAQTNGTSYQSYNMSFTEPWFGGRKPNSFTVSAFYSVQQYASANGSGNQILRSPGFSVGLGKKLNWPDNFFTLYHSLSYQYYTFENFNLIGRFSTGYTNNLNIRHIVSRNSVDHNIFPQSGSTVSLQLQYTPLAIFNKFLNTDKDFTDLTDQQRYKWLEYHKWKADFAHYTRLFSIDKKNKFPVVLMSSANFGYIGQFNRKVGYAPFERFYVGGDGLTGFFLDGRELIRFRGYPNYDAVTPSVKDLFGNTIETGGTIYTKYSFELRTSIINSQAATIYAIAFAEGANAWLRFKDFDPFSIKRSAGVGLRFYLPMFGLLGFDWGYGFDPVLNGTGPSAGHFHFYIGQPLY